MLSSKKKDSLQEYVTEWYELHNGDVKTRQYRFGRLLGRGANSAFYEITLLETKFMSACKVVKKASLDNVT